MNKSELPYQIEKTLLRLLKKASYDSSFRKLCLSDPRLAFRQCSNVDLPEGMNIKFVEENQSIQKEDHMLVFTLPAFDEGQLDDEELDSITGCSIAIAQSAVTCID